VKYNLRGLNIFVRNEEESEFVLRLAWDNDYRWRNGDTAGNENNRLSGHVYREDRTSKGELIYCFDYEEYEEGILSCFGGDDKDDIQRVIDFYGLKFVEASQIMNMDDAAREIFLRLR
jgi:hypothetical protein